MRGNRDTYGFETDTLLSYTSFGVYDKLKNYLAEEPATESSASTSAAAAPAAASSPVFVPSSYSAAPVAPAVETTPFYKQTWFVPAVILASAAAVSGGIFYWNKDS